MKQGTTHYISQWTPPGTLRPAASPPPMTEAERKPKRSLGNAWKFAKAVLSLAIVGGTPRAVRAKRAAACLRCPALRSKPGSGEPIGWCSACGCGDSPRAAMSRKVAMPKATCPKGRWPT